MTINNDLSGVETAVMYDGLLRAVLRTVERRAEEAYLSRQKQATHEVALHLFGGIGDVQPLCNSFFKNNLKKTERKEAKALAAEEITEITNRFYHRHPQPISYETQGYYNEARAWKAEDCTGDCGRGDKEGHSSGGAGQGGGGVQAPVLSLCHRARMARGSGGHHGLAGSRAGESTAARAGTETRDGQAGCTRHHAAPLGLPGVHGNCHRCYVQPSTSAAL